MRVVFVNPQRTVFGGDPVRAGTPLGLLSLAATVRRHLPETDIKLIDAVVEGKTKVRISPNAFRYGLTEGETKQRFLDFGVGEGDVAAISDLHLPEWKNAVECAKIAKAAGATVILGGQHATSEPEFMLRNSEADYIVLGEGEYSFLNLLRAIGQKRTKRTDLDTIPGIAFREGERIIRTTGADPQRTVDLNELPDPAFDLLRPSLYAPRFSCWGPVPENSGPIINYMSSRGCPIGCTFCPNTGMWGKKIRTFSPERVRQQIRKIRELGFDNLAVFDDQVLMLPPELRGVLFTELKQLNMHWVIDAGLYYPLITEDFVSLISQNGCYRVFLPIEHPSLSIMHGESKYLVVKRQSDVRAKIASIFGMFRKFKIDSYVAIMVGFKQETEKTLELVRDYAKFVKSLGASWVVFFFLKPWPGTVDYHRYHTDIPVERDWKTAPEYWTFSTPVIEPSGMNLEEVYRAVNEISMEINGRPNTIVGSDM